jgi:CubicO group peptidase (beta-lactamase class C family)
MKKTILLFCVLFAAQAFAQHLERVKPETLGINSHHLQLADSAIKQAIENNEIPGAVLAVVHQNKMVYLKAYGNKQVYPSTVPMAENTIFDLASVTKPIAGGISAMILVEQGKIRLTDRVGMYIPEFTDNIRIVDLLTHTSGLIAYPQVNQLREKYGAPSQDALISHIATSQRVFEPRTNSRYSCNNLIVLQRVIEVASGQNLRDFVKENISDVLGMNSTDFAPTGGLLPRVAPTQRMADGSVLHGIVHDPMAQILQGGISGNAGLFSDADDLAILSAALLNGGAWNGKRILSPQGVKIMTRVPFHVAEFGRALGWDVSSSYASNQGDLLSASAYGHTGYTGTSLVIDPELDLAIILLTNRVHPNDDGNVTRLRALVANIVAAAITNDK